MLCLGGGGERRKGAGARRGGEGERGTLTRSKTFFNQMGNTEQILKATCAKVT